MYLFGWLVFLNTASPSRVAFPKTFPENVLADVIAANGLKQLHTAETEKYAHVTFFLNGGIEEPKEGEERVLVASPKVATYDLQPEMSAPEVTEKLVAAINEARQSGGGSGGGGIQSAQIDAILVMTKSEYDALDKKDARTLYLLEG